jgi:superfamily I DNA/RNA helicase
MAQMMDKRPEKYEGEKKTWDCIKEFLPDDVICYYNREVSGREFDFCLLIKDYGLLIIEVKGWNTSHISKVKAPDEIILADGTECTSPKKQANGYKFALLNKLQNTYNVNPIIMSMVCYPFMSQKDYERVGLNIVSEPNFTLFAEDISDNRLFSRKIVNVYQDKCHAKYDKLEGYVYDTVRHHFEPMYNTIEPTTPPYSKLMVFSEELSAVQIDEILTSYFEGTKQIVFTNHYSDLELLAKRLSETFWGKRIKVLGNNLEFGANDVSDAVVKIKNNKISIFDFEVVFISDYKLTNEFVIYNGAFEGSQFEILNKLAEYSDFNIKQYQVEHSEVNRDIVVRAGAGTGKTYSMVARIAYLCHSSTNSGIHDLSEEIAMLTFTGDAANNMKSRLKRFFINSFVLTNDVKYLEMVNDVEKMRISTIHSFAKEIIQNTSVVVGVGTNFVTVSGNYERQKIFDRVFTEYLEKINKEEPLFFDRLPIKIDEFRKDILQFSKLLYNKGCDIKEVSLQAFGSPIEEIPFMNELIEKVIIETEKQYTMQLRDNNCLSLNEYMVYLSKCIESETFNKNLLKFKYIFIDEFQDTDDAQINAFMAMQKKLEFKFFVVGDLKQSIYRFRGATMGAFDKMKCNSEEWLNFTLNLNYRSDARLLDRYKMLFTSLGKEKLLPYMDDRDELSGVKTIDEYSDNELIEYYPYTTRDNGKSGVSYDELFGIVKKEIAKTQGIMANKKLSQAERTIAILARENFRVDEVLREAKKRDVVVESDSGGDLYKLTPAKDLCKLTSALCNPYNTSYLYALIQSNYINSDFKLSGLIGKSDSEKLEIMISVLDDFYSQIMHKNWSQIISDAQEQPILKVIHVIYENSMPWKQYAFEDVAKQEYYRINHELVFEELSNGNRQSYLTLDAVNETLHINILTGTETKSRELSTDTDGVRVICTTVHKSKGLEYGTVILPFTDGRLGTSKKNSIDVTVVDGQIGYCFTSDYKDYCNEYYHSETELKENMMEESRILYVALTRAINKFIWFGRVNSEEICWGEMLKELG